MSVIRGLGDMFAGTRDGEGRVVMAKGRRFARVRRSFAVESLWDHYEGKATTKGLPVKEGKKEVLRRVCIRVN